MKKRERLDSDFLLLGDGNHVSAFEIIVSNSGEYWELNYTAHVGLVSSNKIYDITKHKFYKKYLKQKISEYMAMQNHPLWECFQRLQKLEYKEPCGNYLGNGLELKYVESNYDVYKKVVSKIYIKNGKLYVPRIAKKIVRAISEGLDPFQIKLSEEELENIKDNSVNLQSLVK